MTTLARTEFLKTLPDFVVARLPEPLQGIKSRQPYRWLIQFHFGEPALHYEVSPAWRRPGWEIGFHCEAKDKTLNRYLLTGFRRHLFEIKDELGETVEAEMWSRGWTKVYNVLPDVPLTTEYQAEVATCLAHMITCLQPIFADLRNDVKRIYR